MPKARDWRKELDNHPWIKERRALLWARLKKELGRDKAFIRETMQLSADLERAYQENPQIISHFFKHFTYATTLHLDKIDKFLGNVSNPRLRRLFRRYIEYVARFGCVLRLQPTKKRRLFWVTALIPGAPKLQGRIFEGHLYPLSDSGDDPPYEYALEAPRLSLPSALNRLVSSGKARFVQISDDDGSSILSELEYASYHMNGLTFILHNAERPYVFCLIGEMVTNEGWRNAAKAVHALQRHCFRREKAGKPADIRQRFKVEAQMRKPGADKVKALEVGKTKNAGTSFSSYSQLKRQLS